MRTAIRLSLKELQKKKLFTVLLLSVCITAMSATVTAVTNAASAVYQQKEFEQNIGFDPKRTLHLHYANAEETQQFANDVQQYFRELSNLETIQCIGRFDFCSVFFRELQDSVEYTKVNQKILKGSIYENHPNCTQMLFADESVLSFIKNDFEGYKDTASEELAIYVSEAFKNVLPIGTVLTEERTETRYKVVGFFSENAKWVDENDAIRFPLVSMKGWCIAPFSKESETDILTQLSTLHNTYVFALDTAEIEVLKREVTATAQKIGLEVTAQTVAEEYVQYKKETEAFSKRQIGIAVFVGVMAVSAIIAAFTTNTILKRKQYGILLANGFRQRQIAWSILSEIMMILVPAALTAWVCKLAELMLSTSVSIRMFRNVLLTAHIKYTLPVCIAAAIAVGSISSILPIMKLFVYQPSELIGGENSAVD